MAAYCLVDSAAGARLETTNPIGYDLTVVSDATADYSDDAMHAALDVNMPNYAAIVTTSELVESMASLGEVSARPPAGGS